MQRPRRAVPAIAGRRHRALGTPQRRVAARPERRLLRPDRLATCSAAASPADRRVPAPGRTSSRIGGRSATCGALHSTRPGGRLGGAEAAPAIGATMNDCSARVHRGAAFVGASVAVTIEVRPVSRCDLRRGRGRPPRCRNARSMLAASLITVSRRARLGRARRRRPARRPASAAASAIEAGEQHASVVSTDEHGANAPPSTHVGAPAAAARRRLAATHDRSRRRPTGGKKAAGAAAGSAARRRTPRPARSADRSRRRRPAGATDHAWTRRIPRPPPVTCAGDPTESPPHRTQGRSTIRMTVRPSVDGTTSATTPTPHTQPGADHHGRAQRLPIDRRARRRSTMRRRLPTASQAIRGPHSPGQRMRAVAIRRIARSKDLPIGRAAWPTNAADAPRLVRRPSRMERCRRGSDSG